MAKTTSKKQTQTKSSKTESDYFVINRLTQLSQQLTEFAAEYNDKLVSPSIAATRETLDLLKKDPKKAMDKIKDDGLKILEDARDEVELKITDLREEGRDIIKELTDDPGQVLGDYLKEGQSLAKGALGDVVELSEKLVQDVRTLKGNFQADSGDRMNDIIKTGKKYIEALPGMDIVEDGVEKIFQWLPKPFKLSAQGDLKQLADAVEKLNAGVEKLQKRMAK